MPKLIDASTCEHFEKVTSVFNPRVPNEEWNTAAHLFGAPFTRAIKMLASDKYSDRFTVYPIYSNIWYHDPFFCQTWRNKQPNKTKPHSHISLMSLAEILQEYEAKYSTSVNSTTLESSWTNFLECLWSTFSFILSMHITSCLHLVSIASRCI